MDEIEIIGPRRLNGEIEPPGDKSVGIRALLLGAMARGETVVRGAGPGRAMAAATKALRAMGVRAGGPPDEIRVWGQDMEGLTQPLVAVDCGQSATMFRLAAGVAARPFAYMTGAPQLLARPMGGLKAALESMGFGVRLAAGERAPMAVWAPAAPASEEVTVFAGTSAQLKSVALLAGAARGMAVRVVTAGESRDHTEHMLRAVGVAVASAGGEIRLNARDAQVLPAREWQVPGDFSAAAFFLAGAVLCPDSRVMIRGVGLNARRLGLWDILTRMGMRGTKTVTGDSGWGEEVGCLSVESSALRAVEVAPEEVGTVIDELPLLALVATQARGVTRVQGAAALRDKESDRIAGVARMLGAMGAVVVERSDGFEVKGPVKLRGAAIDAAGDHRLAMLGAVAACVARGKTVIHGAQAWDESYPVFGDELARVSK